MAIKTCETNLNLSQDISFEPIGDQVKWGEGIARTSDHNIGHEGRVIMDTAGTLHLNQALHPWTENENELYTGPDNETNLIRSNKIEWIE